MLDLILFFVLLSLIVSSYKDNGPDMPQPSRQKSKFEPAAPLAKPFQEMKLPKLKPNLYKKTFYANEPKPRRSV